MRRRSFLALAGSAAAFPALASKFALYPQDFGAIGDGVTLDDGPFAAFLQAWGEQGGLAVIDRDFALALPHSVALDKDARLTGGGRLIRTTSGDGLTITVTTTGKRFALDGLAIETSVISDGHPLRLVMPATDYPFGPGPELRNLVARGVDRTAHAWRKPVQVVNAKQIRVDNLQVFGREQTQPPFDCAGAIEYVDCLGIDHTAGYSQWVQDAIVLSGTRCEGLSLMGGSYVGVNRGIVSTAKPYTLGGTAIVGTHVNAYNFCVELGNVGDLTIANSLFYKTHVSQVYWQGIRVIGADGLVIMGNMIAAPGAPYIPGGANDAIVLQDVQRCQVFGNRAGPFPGPGAAMILVGNSSLNRIGPNLYGLNCNGQHNWSSGSGNVFV